VTTLLQDLRQGFRSLRRTPVITATAILTLALGVGASTAVFSAVHAVLLRPLPYPEPDDLIELFEENRSLGSTSRASALNYLSWADRSKPFEAIAAFRNGNVTLTGDQDPEIVNGCVVTASLFRVLGVAPVVGRMLQPSDEQRGSARVVVLSESLWEARYGADRRIVGRSITLDGERHEVVGVMPRAFREVGRAQASGTPDAQLFTPLLIDPSQENRGNHTLRVVGRLRRGVALEQARDEMRAIAAAMETEFPATNKDWGVQIETLSATMFDPQAKRSLLLVLGAVMLVFLIASANVANLMLVRGTRRRRELAVRTALGASRARLVRQLLTESAGLAALSGVAGVIAASIALPVVRALLPPMARLDEMRLDLNVLAFGIFASLVSGLAFGTVPALRASRVDLAPTMMAAGRTTAGRSRGRMQQTLIVGQIALATVLLVSAALLLQGFVRLQGVPLGFEPDNVLTARVSLPPNGYPDAARTRQFYEQVLTTLRASGQLQAVAIATSAPFGPGVRVGFQASTQGAAQHIVSGNYFRVLDIPLLAGRSFNEQDVPGSTAVAVVSQRLVRVLWPNTNPVGQIVERSGQTLQIVGVVGDVRGSDTSGARGGGPDREPRAAVYLSAAQMPQRTMTLIARPRGEPSGVIAAIREAVRQADPALPLQQVRPLRDWLTESLTPTRLTTTLATAFAVSGLLLACVGLYGVLAYIVASRTKEIGVRVAMGATRGNVMALVFGEGMRWAAAGILAGLIGASAATKLIATVLFDVPARDPLTFATVAAAMALVALVACAIPAARAVRIDPTIAMRSD